MVFRFIDYRKISGTKENPILNIPKQFKAKKGDIVAVYASEDGKALLIELTPTPKPRTETDR